MSFWKAIWNVFLGREPDEIFDQKSNTSDIRVEVRSSFDDRPISHAGKRQPGDFYVYVHRDIEGQVFYVGKGIGNRAYEPGRGALWDAYLREYSGGQYEVEIIEKGLSEDSALAVEAEHISRISRNPNNLVNRVFDPPDSDQEQRSEFLKRLRLNSEATDATRALEKENLGAAIDRYFSLLGDLRDLAYIKYDSSRVGRLKQRMWTGNQKLLNRLTICLAKQKRYSELIEVVDQYCQDFTGGLGGVRGEAIRKRLDRARKLIRDKGPKAADR